MVPFWVFEKKKENRLLYSINAVLKKFKVFDFYLDSF